MSAVCVSVVCLVLGREGGLELEVGILAFADAPEVGFLVGGDAVVADVEGRQCPNGEKYIRGRTEDILVLTGTWGERQPAQWRLKP